jgi:hypothetical protein
VFSGWFFRFRVPLFWTTVFLLNPCGGGEVRFSGGFFPSPVWCVLFWWWCDGLWAVCVLSLALLYPVWCVLFCGLFVSGWGFVLRVWWFGGRVSGGGW